jgi:hypothetical protein
MRATGTLLLLATLLAGCAAERHVYRDSDGRTREQWKCPYAWCLGVGTAPMK